MKNLFENELRNFENYSLENCEKLAFQNRFDTKFILKIDGAVDFLQNKNIAQNYSILQVDNSKVQDYDTLYFDTPDLFCFKCHKNGRANRFKFRTRHYLSNGKIFNEIKKKLNTGKTIKFRKKREVFQQEFDADFEELAKENGFFCENLSPSLAVKFSRITLLSKNFPERATLDFGLKYEFLDKKISLPNTAIIEIKREKNGERTFLQKYLRSKHIEPSGFSKYCVGICLTKEDIKKNIFLPKIRNLFFENERESENYL
ncbi:MAG: polyphosphate polymerase domain-containing protein [Chitinivibrionia bacterium]|nr:polyphosphate polymerase domain-containing protein [Chitinivibrionia bacterium]